MSERSRILALLKKWCNSMTCSHEGIVSLSNLLYDAERVRFQSLDILREFLMEVATINEFNTKGCLETFREVVSNGSNMYLCKGKEAPPSSTLQYSRVVTTKDFVEFNILDEFRPQIGLPNRGRLSKKHVDNIKYHLNADEFEDFTTGCIRGRLAFAWVTKTDNLTKLRKENPKDSDYADAVQKRLGLAHLIDDRIIEIRYPTDALSDEKLFVPTFLEGCPSRIFRSYTDNTDNWGRAVDLGTMAHGLPEAVHKPIKFTRKFELEDIGNLPSPPPDYSEQDFLETLPSLWKSDDSYRKLVSHVQW